MPGLLRLLQLSPSSSLVDFGCGQGILTQALPQIAGYLGIDASAELIKYACTHCKKQNYTFVCKDVTKPLLTNASHFSHAVFLLSLQNMRNWDGALNNATRMLDENGTIVLVLNHPCFRVPRQSGWGVDENTKQQYRWMNRYISPLEVPITMSPGQPNSSVTWSFHRSMQEIVGLLTDRGFAVTALEEWISNKSSSGSAARMENRARSEFPLFLAIRAKKDK